MKKQVVVIHGGDTFENREVYLNFLKNFEIDIERYKVSKNDWKPWLRSRLGEEYEVILPVMPNKTNAQFEEWKIWFEKIAHFLNDEVILIGHSLGATFLFKYLSENKFPRKISGVFLVCGVFDKDTEGYPLASFSLQTNLSTEKLSSESSESPEVKSAPEKIDLQTENIFLYHSKDDPVVPFFALDSFMKVLPTAHPRVFEDRKHINEPEFEELAADVERVLNI